MEPPKRIELLFADYETAVVPLDYGDIAPEGAYSVDVDEDWQQEEEDKEEQQQTLMVTG